MVTKDCVGLVAHMGIVYQDLGVQDISIRAGGEGGNQSRSGFRVDIMMTITNDQCSH